MNSVPKYVQRRGLLQFPDKRETSKIFDVKILHSLCVDNAVSFKMNVKWEIFNKI